MNKKMRRRLIVIAVIVLAIAAIGAELMRELKNRQLTVSLDAEQATTVLNDALDALADPTSEGALALAQMIEVKVSAVREGDAKNLFFTCSYTTVDVRQAVMSQVNELLGPLAKSEERLNATKIKQKIQAQVAELIRAGRVLEGEAEIEMCEMQDGSLMLFCEDKVIDALFGGILTMYEEISALETITFEGETLDISKRTTIRNGLRSAVALVNYEHDRPTNSGPLLDFWTDFSNDFYDNFIQDDMWQYLTDGLLVTLELTACAILLGILLGFLVAIVRTTHDRTGGLSLLNAICKVYLSVIRGTPVMIQLLIIHFVFLLPLGVPRFLSAVLCFGINSGAYVAEIIRGGMMSVEQGQSEAGRSLGLNYAQTMIYIVIPQAFKAVLPSLANEFIVLLKESSVAFYIGVADLTQGGLRIRSLTYTTFMPLLAVALIYWVVVVILTNLVGILERRLRKSER